MLPVNAIITEVERLKETLDAIADLSLAEGVFQVTQGNYERAGAMLKALSEGTCATRSGDRAARREVARL